jgi:pimeloyl-ACP methyl ester carboxylesterase
MFLLLHSPVVGPATWRWVARSLTALRQPTAVPDLRDAASSGRFDIFIQSAAAAAPSDWPRVVVVGHSGAGPILPSVAEVLGARASTVVFVDAGLPPCTGDATVGGEFLTHLRQLADDGRLPRWSTWWGSGTMRTLVPDANRRASIEEELREVPLSLFESRVVVPERWCESSSAAYLLLSAAYREDADRARALGWPVVERLGGHLDTVIHPDPIAEVLVDVSI